MNGNNIYEQMEEEIRDSNLCVHGIEIFHNGQIEFRKAFDADVRYPIYSATKSFTSTAIGIASDEGRLSIDDPLSGYLEKNCIENMPAHLREGFCSLPIKRFLTMSVPGYPFRPEGDNWLKNVLEHEAGYTREPEFSYTNISAYLAGIACENAVGGDLTAYLKPRLFEPLGISDPVYQCDPQGHFYGATGMYLTVHELSLLGQLYLMKGTLNGKRIISENWVSEATRLQTDNKDGGYGYFFWMNGPYYSISGKWGQKCLVCPEKNAVITYLGDMREESDKMYRIAEKIADGYL
ncbi:MAG: serine hydrolase domain-containing protein [Porcipelethomonas sp.]